LLKRITTLGLGQKLIIHYTAGLILQNTQESNESLCQMTSIQKHNLCFSKLYDSLTRLRMNLVSSLLFHKQVEMRNNTATHIPHVTISLHNFIIDSLTQSLLT